MWLEDLWWSGCPWIKIKLGSPEKSDSTAFLKMPEDSLSSHPISGKFGLSTAYLAPIAYYKILANAEEVFLEQQESYVKQTYRNRCTIATANGLMNLTIPIEKSEFGKNNIRDVKIADFKNWQQQHWRSIEAAYNSSPFFEYYVDDLVPFYEKNQQFLWDFNLELQSVILELMDIDVNLFLTADYQHQFTDDTIDLRHRISPKGSPYIANLKPYYQVFEHKLGFQANLSIIDLLFNMGNESILILKDH